MHCGKISSAATSRDSKAFLGPKLQQKYLKTCPKIVLRYICLKFTKTIWANFKLCHFLSYCLHLFLKKDIDFVVVNFA